MILNVLQTQRFLLIFKKKPNDYWRTDRETSTGDLAIYDNLQLALDALECLRREGWEVYLTAIIA